MASLSFDSTFFFALSIDSFALRGYKKTRSSFKMLLIFKISLKL